MIFKLTLKLENPKSCKKLTNASEFYPTIFCIYRTEDNQFKQAFLLIFTNNNLLDLLSIINKLAENGNSRTLVENHDKAIINQYYPSMSSFVIRKADQEVKITNCVTIFKARNS
ncbi:hypothetical protein BpHYR1_016900 [Brachionus plicatilis]|uniref:Uncharacterized protein n=1 Tax=Brachionus plicatilis TaxID=10195 RepID=A0A3M7RG68_BRAPC|nr:hypothetical protein BpHYR1_016900 [Brachionus plicatilis]